MENPELLLLEFEEFNRTSNSQDDHISQNLENFIEYVSKTGTYIFPWSLVKKLFLKKLNNVINNLQSCMSLSTSDLNTSSSSTYIPNQNTANDANSIQLIKDRIFERMQSFNNAPFTIQRICELLLKPNNHYNRIDKYLRGLEKCIMVVTTVDSNGNKIFMENSMTNGISNPSTPLITPTRSTTPPIERNTESATNESLVLTTPPKEELNEKQEILASSSETSTNTLATKSSDELATESLTESIQETETDNSLKVEVAVSNLTVQNKEMDENILTPQSIEMETTEQQSVETTIDESGSEEMATNNQLELSNTIKNETKESTSQNVPSNDIVVNCEKTEINMETESVKTEDVLVNVSNENVESKAENLETSPSKESVSKTEEANQ